MEIPGETIRSNFQSRTDTELLRLAHSGHEMTSEARLLLLTEIQNRSARIKETSETVQLIHGWYTVVAPIVEIKFPELCPRCSRSETGSPLRFQSLEHRKFRFLYWKSDRVILAVPHCPKCAADLKRTRTICSWSGGLLAFLWLATAIWFRIPRLVNYVGLVMISLPILYLYDRTSAVKLGDYGEEAVEYRFRSPEYAKAFAMLNNVQAENAETLQSELEEAVSRLRQ